MDDFESLIKKGDEAYRKDRYEQAICYYEDAFKLASDGNKNKLMPILPMMSRCYRQMGCSDTVIKLAKDAKEKFGPNFISSVFLTSIAAAYLDLNKKSEARKCVDAAKKKLKGDKIPPPLQLVIDKLEG